VYSLAIQVFSPLTIPSLNVKNLRKNVRIVSKVKIRYSLKITFFIPRQKQAFIDDVWRLTLDLPTSFPVSLDSDLLTVFLDGGRWTELILGSV